MSTQVIHGNSLNELPYLEDCSVDAIITDPPYELGFMNKKWDASGIAYDINIWAHCLRVLKPGGHLLAFGGTRTYHRMACAIEDAGFEVRDSINWIYGCLDERTEVATEDGVKPYHKTKIGDSVLCYDVSTKTYSYQPILEIVEYDYQDTAYRIIGDTFEQVVSKNHRVIVERDGIEAFHYAETLQSEANIPILESLPQLRKALHDQQSRAGAQEQNMFEDMCQCRDRQSKYRTKGVEGKKGTSNYLRRMWGGSLEANLMVEESKKPNLFISMQREIAGSRIEKARISGSVLLDERIRSEVENTDDWGIEPSMEGRSHVSQPKGFVRESINKIRSVPYRLFRNGSEGRLRHGASAISGVTSGKNFDSDGSCSSCQSRRNGQLGNKSHAVRNEQGTQSVREWPGHKTSMVRIVSFQYTGKVWCLRVPTGAFVAVRDGVAFPTGNSGFPKSLDVSKAIDKAAGAEREIIGERKLGGNAAQSTQEKGGTFASNTNSVGVEPISVPITTPSTDEAKQWEGWGTALKPAHEPIVLARKPFEDTVANNVMQHGTGALNIDGTRVGEGGQGTWASPRGGIWKTDSEQKAELLSSTVGRWPANVIIDDSIEAAWSPFFYCAKAGKSERNAGLPKDANIHPTVKPLELMKYLCRLITPPNGIILDPFAGSGSTLVAATLEGFNSIGIEMTADYLPIIEARIKWAESQIAP
jgi:site-specific DNA-methyltransferase (adenine-specific)